MSNMDDLMSPAKVKEAEVLQEGVIKIHDKYYRTVALRVHLFRQEHPDWSLQTKVVLENADVIRMQCVVRNANGRKVSTGTAQESASRGSINKFSHIENCETSCVGRALAFLGYGGQEIASASELEQALALQELDKKENPLAAHDKAKAENQASIDYIKDAIEKDDMLAVAEAWLELTNEDKTALWVAPSKGGVFTTHERKVLKSNEFYQATKEVN